MSTHALSAGAARRFAELESSAAARPVVDRLRALIAEGSDFDLYKMNAFRFAAELGVERREALRAFLFATRLGVTDLAWDVHCPSCAGLPEFHAHLMQLRRRAHCGLCNIDFELDFEEQIEVTFTINPDIRRIEYKDFRDRVFPEHLQYFQQMVGREHRAAELQGLISPGEPLSMRGNLPQGEYVMEVPGHRGGAATLTIAGAPEEREQTLAIAIDPGGSVTPPALSARPGPVHVTGTVHYPKPQWGFKVAGKKLPNNWVSAAFVTSQQDFRDLFSGEFLAPDLSFAIRSTTLMFTDIKGSTELYERLGDAAAYALVQQHFRLMTEAIRRHDGGIVKTIGDAVMASFPVNAGAVAAALEIQTSFAAAPEELALVEIKIGLHRGPAIAVTSNRMLDYFGRTVNVAARVQGESRPREVLVTDAVLSDPKVAALLAERTLEPKSFEAQLKGISGRVKLYALRPI